MPHSGGGGATKNWSDSFLQDFPRVIKQPYHNQPPHPHPQIYKETPEGRGERPGASIIYVARGHSLTFPPRSHLKWDFKMKSAHNMGSKQFISCLLSWEPTAPLRCCSPEIVHRVAPGVWEYSQV